MQRTYLTAWKQYLTEQDALDKYPSYDENGNKIPYGDIKQYITKPEVVITRSGNKTSVPYFFRLKQRHGDTPGNKTTVAMYLPDTGEWIDVDTNQVLMTSQRNFSEDAALKFLRHNGYLNRWNPRA